MRYVKTKAQTDKDTETQITHERKEMSNITSMETNLKQDTLL